MPHTLICKWRERTWLRKVRRRRGFPPRWETLVGDEGGEEEGRRRRRGLRRKAEMMLPPLIPTPLALSLLWAEMMYGCKGHMLAVWWIKALCRKITESASAHTSIALNKTLFNIEMERPRERERVRDKKKIKEDGGQEQGVVEVAHKHSNTHCPLWLIWNIEKSRKTACL